MCFRASCKTLICLHSASGCPMSSHSCDRNAACPVFFRNSTSRSWALSCSWVSTLLIPSKVCKATVYMGKCMGSTSSVGWVLRDLAYSARGVKVAPQPQNAMAPRATWLWVLHLGHTCRDSSHIECLCGTRIPWSEFSENSPVLERMPIIRFWFELEKLGIRVRHFFPPVSSAHLVIDGVKEVKEREGNRSWSCQGGFKYGNPAARGIHKSCLASWMGPIIISYPLVN